MKETGYFYSNNEPILLNDEVWIDSGGYNTFRRGIVMETNDGFRIKDCHERILTLEEFRDLDYHEEIHKHEEII